jgi:hypothetical protein
MNNTLAQVTDRKIAVREYKNKKGELSRTATTDKRLSFKEFGQELGLEIGGEKHRAEFSRYCQARNAEAVAFVEKARNSGLSLSNSVESVDKDGKLVAVRIAFTKAKTTKEKVPTLTEGQKLKALSSMSEAELLAEIAKRKQPKAIDIKS